MNFIDTFFQTFPKQLNKYRFLKTRVGKYLDVLPLESFSTLDCITGFAAEFPVIVAFVAWI